MLLLRYAPHASALLLIFACGKSETSGSSNVNRASASWGTASGFIASELTIASPETGLTPSASVSSSVAGIGASAAGSSAAAAGEAPRWIELGGISAYRAVDPVGLHLADAVDALNQGQTEAAARSLKRAAITLIDEVEDVPNSHRVTRAAANRLQKLSLQVEAGNVDRAALDTAILAAYGADLVRHWPELEDVSWLSRYDQPDVHLSEAKLALTDDKPKAATELGKAASYLQLQALRARGLCKTLLLNSTNDLKKLAKQLNTANAVSMKAFQTAERLSAQALACFHYHQAVDLQAPGATSPSSAVR